MSPSDELYKRGPTEILEYAIVHLHRGKDFDLYIGFLLLDIAVEGILKKYLIAPAYIAKKNNRFREQERKSIVEAGKFHGIVDAARNSYIGSSPFEWERLNDFHQLRNQLYHEGSGMTVRREDAFTYARVATTLLEMLLGVNRGDLLDKPIREQEASERLRTQFEDQTVRLKQTWNDLHKEIELLLDRVAPEILRPRFAYRMEQEYIRFQELIKNEDVSRTVLFNFMESLKNLLLNALDHPILATEIQDLESFYLLFFRHLYHRIDDDGGLTAISLEDSARGMILDYIQSMINIDIIKIGVLRLEIPLHFAEEIYDDFNRYRVRLIESKGAPWWENHASLTAEINVREDLIHRLKSHASRIREFH